MTFEETLIESEPEDPPSALNLKFLVSLLLTVLTGSGSRITGFGFSTTFGSLVDFPAILSSLTPAMLSVSL